MQKPVDERICHEINQRIAQQSKNHRDEIYQLNQRMDQILSTVARIELRQSEKIAALESQIKQIEVYFENLEKGFTKLTSTCKSETDSVSRDIKTLTELFSSHNDLIGKLFRSVDLSKASHDVTSKRVDVLEKKNQRTELLMEMNNTSIRGKVDAILYEFQQDIEKKIPSLTPVCNRIDQKISEIDVDLAGFRRELELIKHDVHYGEKKFENIYTLIGRLRGN